MIDTTIDTGYEWNRREYVQMGIDGDEMPDTRVRKPMTRSICLRVTDT